MFELGCLCLIITFCLLVFAFYVVDKASDRKDIAGSIIFFLITAVFALIGVSLILAYYLREIATAINRID